MDDRLLRQAAVYGPEFVAQLLEYERIIHEVAETLATQQGIPLHLLPPRQPPAVPHPDTHPHPHPHPHALPPP
ncbi:hypothetical protein ACSR0Z_28050 [Streptomyces viridosporus]